MSLYTHSKHDEPKSINKHLTTINTLKKSFINNWRAMIGVMSVVLIFITAFALKSYIHNKNMENMYLEAVRTNQSGKHKEALALMNQVISKYPESIYAKWARKDIFLIDQSIREITNDDITVTGLQAFLIYHNGGESPDVLTDPKTRESLWNTIIGEGSAGGASSAVRVVVEVRGTPGAIRSGKTIVIETCNGTLKKSQEFPIHTLDNKGIAKFELKVRDTGCSTLSLKAFLKGDVKQLNGVIPFRCGE